MRGFDAAELLDLKEKESDSVRYQARSINVETGFRPAKPAVNSCQK
jgi:hypothetical protein